ncbi:hypothetical protein J6590_007091 [Homalodisca vitripennis]|nr:hypothetical protein J6590_007091 [Homalodisca vitripennis]
MDGIHRISSVYSNLPVNPGVHIHNISRGCPGCTCNSWLDGLLHNHFQLEQEICADTEPSRNHVKAIMLATWLLGCHLDSATYVHTPIPLYRARPSLTAYTQRTLATYTVT